MTSPQKSSSRSRSKSRTKRSRSLSRSSKRRSRSPSRHLRSRSRSPSKYSGSISSTPPFRVYILVGTYAPYHWDKKLWNEYQQVIDHLETNNDPFDFIKIMDEVAGIKLRIYSNKSDEVYEIFYDVVDVKKYPISQSAMRKIIRELRKRIIKFKFLGDEFMLTYKDRLKYWSNFLTIRAIFRDSNPLTGEREEDLFTRTSKKIL